MIPSVFRSFLSWFFLAVWLNACRVHVLTAERVCFYFYYIFFLPNRLNYFAIKEILHLRFSLDSPLLCSFSLRQTIKIEIILWWRSLHSIACSKYHFNCREIGPSILSENLCKLLASSACRWYPKLINSDLNATYSLKCKW